MNIVMPMAGRGSRFAQVGIDTPKPLIDVRGKPMYAWATDGLPLDRARRLIFICLYFIFLKCMNDCADDIIRLKSRRRIGWDTERFEDTLGFLKLENESTLRFSSSGFVIFVSFMTMGWSW